MIPRGGKILRAARKARGMTQCYVANCHGVDADTVSRWERLKTPIPFDDAIWIITDILKMSFNEAMELVTDENN
jgi:transcriptional regulator with XRE-family HTH domain